MNRYFSLHLALILSLSLICCGGKKIKLESDESVIDIEVIQEGIIAQESSQNLPSIPFYELEDSIEDIQKQIIQLQARVSEYEDRPSETNYTEKLKALIDEPLPIHKIILEKQNQDSWYFSIVNNVGR